MVVRVRFGEEYAHFPDDTPEEEIFRLRDEWEELGYNLGAVWQRRQLYELPSSQDFLSLPRIERHAAFNKLAQAGPYWQMLTPDERRALRGIVVDTDGANEEETYSVARAPISGTEDIESDYGDVVEKYIYSTKGYNPITKQLAEIAGDLVRGVQRGSTALTSRLSGAANLADSFTMALEQAPVIPLGTTSQLYTNPLYQTDVAKKMHEATGPVAEMAREVAVDAAVGNEMIAPKRRFETLAEASEEEPLLGPAKYAAGLFGEQAPVMGPMVATAMVNPALAAADAAAMQTGSILTDLEAEGVTGEDAQLAASTLGVLTGALEFAPVGRLLARNPITAKSFKTWLARKGLEALRQGAEEVLTEVPQTLVESAAADFVRMNRGELENIEAFTTPEGRSETWGNVIRSIEEAGLMGTMMGPFGGGAGNIQAQTEVGPGPTGEEVAARTDAVRADMGPAVPEFVQTEPIPETQPDVRPEEFVVPPGSPAPSGVDVAPLYGPGGSARLAPPEGVEAARAGYAPDWLKVRPELFQAFVTGDLDQDTQAAIVDLAGEQGLSPQEAMRQLATTINKADELVAGQRMQAETETFAELPPPPSQRGQRNLSEGVGRGPAAPAVGGPVVGGPAAPTQPHGVESGAMRLDEGKQVEEGATPEPVTPLPPIEKPKNPWEMTTQEYEQTGAEEDHEAVLKKAIRKGVVLDEEVIALHPHLRRLKGQRRLGRTIHQIVLENGGIGKHTGGYLSEEIYGDKGREGVPVRYRRKDGMKPDQMLEVVKEEGYLPPSATVGDLIAALQKPDISPEEYLAQQEAADQFIEMPDERREEPGRRREIDKVKNDIFEFQRKNNIEPAIVQKLVRGLEEGQTVNQIYESDVQIEEQLGGEARDLALELEAAVSERNILERFTREEAPEETIEDVERRMFGRRRTADDVVDQMYRVAREQDNSPKAVAEFIKRIEAGESAIEILTRKDEELVQSLDPEIHDLAIVLEDEIARRTEFEPAATTEAPARAEDVESGVTIQSRIKDLTAQLNNANPAEKKKISEEILRLRRIQIATKKEGEARKRKAEQDKEDKGVRARAAKLVPKIQKAFRGWNVRHTQGGLFRLTREGQPVLHVAVGGPGPTIDDEFIKTAAENRNIKPEDLVAALDAGTVKVQGRYRIGQQGDMSGAHLISLYNPKRISQEVFHESFHFAFHNVLTNDQRMTLLKVYETEEGAAQAYQAWAETRAEAEPRATQIFKFLQRFAQSLLENVAGLKIADIEGAAGIMEQIASGEIFETQKGEAAIITDPTGQKILRTIRNDILSARRAAEEAFDYRKLAPEEFPEAWRNAIEGAGTEKLIDRGDAQTVYSLSGAHELSGDQHPGVQIEDHTLTEYYRNRAEKTLFDRIAPIRTIQEKLTEVGQELDEIFDAYLKAQNFQARAGALVDWVEEKLFKPLITDIAKSGIHLEDFDLFRMAAHALERNPKIRMANVTLPIKQAEAKIAKLETKHLSIGTKVRSLENNAKGEVVAVNRESGIAEVRFFNERGFSAKPKRVEMRTLERESVAREKEKIAEIRRMDEAGEAPHSGITDEHAKAALEEMRELGLVEWDGELGPDTVYRGKLGRLSRRFSDIVRWKEETLFRAGLLSKDELKKWRDYKHYAPMRGKDPDILDIIANGRRPPIPEIEMYGGKMWHRALARAARGLGIADKIHLPNTGRGYNPGRRPAAHRALGRRSFPTHSATVELMTDAMETAVRAEKNRVAKTVWNFVQKMKNVKDVNGEKLFEIDRPDSRLVWDEKTQTVKTKIDGLSVVKDNVYNVWIDGELHYIRHVSPGMAEFVSALNNVGSSKDLNPILKAGVNINRYISKMATSRNPAFVIPNAVRDALTAGIKLGGEKKFEGFGLKTMKRVPEAAALLGEYARRQSKGTLDQMDATKRQRIEQFKLAGGETAFWMIPDLADQMRKIQAQIEQTKGEQNKVFSTVKSVINWIEDYNAAVEGMLRFSVFERGLEIGLSKDRAGKLARDITVDFTQQGTVAQYLSPWYVFANASLQGSKMVIDSVAKNRQVQKMMLGAMGYGFMHASMMRWVGGEDEKDKIPYWDKIPAWEKKRNLIFMVPGGEGKRFKIPLPWGFNLFPAAGVFAADAVNRALDRPSETKDAAWEGTAHILSAGLSAFNPIGDNDPTTLVGLVQMGMPAWLDPVYDISANRNFWGGPIRPEPSKFARSEQYGVPTPNYNRYFSSVSKPSKEMTRFMYKHLGIDISPEDIDYAIGAALGGLGDTVIRGLSLLSKGAAGETLSARDVPVLKSFFAEESQFFAPNMYRANMGDYWIKKETYDELTKTDPKAAADFYKRHKNVLAIEEIVKATEKRVRELRKAGVTVKDSRMQNEFKKFNRRYRTIELQTLKRRLKKE